MYEDEADKKKYIFVTWVIIAGFILFIFMVMAPPMCKTTEDVEQAKRSGINEEIQNG